MSTAAASTKKQTEKKVQGGRKGRRAWRKNIDLEDVEEGLEELREEERQGGAAIQDRKDADLFVVDIAGDSNTRSKFKNKKLRLDEILGKRSKVEVPVLGAKMGEARRKRKGAHEAKMRLKRVAGFVEGRRVAAEKIKTAKSTGEYDIWDAAPNNAVATERKAMGTKSREKLAHLSALPAVEVAHPGASYHPDMAKHRELIEKAGADYASVLRKQERIESLPTVKGVSDYDSMLERAETIARDLEEEAQRKERQRKSDDNGATTDSDDSDVSGNEDEAIDSDSSDDVEDDKTVVDGEDESDEQSSKLAKPSRRKTRADRNRERRAVQKRTEEQRAKQTKKQLQQLAIAKKINREVDQLVEKREQSAEHKRKLAIEKSSKPRSKLGKYKVPQLPEAVKLTEELPGSLRNLKPESNGFAEAYNSLLRRNFIEPQERGRQQKRPRKIKTTEKWSYKDFK
ncbi:hypothetical protein GGI12_003563 [Dipsacomyces acuminosporus]|nr:hypothetical protein GGI12_003563 [Dipsacomyces acuminosporus]